MDIIELHHLTKTYKDKTAFQDVNLNIPAGAFTVIRGESGAGKSTLLNTIAGLEPITSGQVIVDSQDITQLSASDRIRFYRTEIGIIFQGSYLQPELSLLENITLPGVFASLKPSERDSRAHQLADMLGIADVLCRRLWWSSRARLHCSCPPSRSQDYPRRRTHQQSRPRERSHRTQDSQFSPSQFPPHHHYCQP